MTEVVKPALGRLERVELRDALLPKLISGQIRVKDAERIAVEAGA